MQFSTEYVGTVSNVNRGLAWGSDGRCMHAECGLVCVNSKDDFVWHWLAVKRTIAGKERPHLLVWEKLEPE